MNDQPGRIVLMGSGEATPSGRRTFDWLFRRLPTPLHIALLETPAGFQPNSALVAQRIVTFLQQHLSSYDLSIVTVPARGRGATLGTGDPALATQVLLADAVFLGPGSPTYAVRQLRDSLVWDAVRLRLSEGGTLVLASAAVLALGAYTLPVYEIYKVGADLSWEAGLNLVRTPRAPLVFVPHWSNNEGGADLDTSHCFMGAERFALLRAMLPPEAIIVAIDEHTSLVLEPAAHLGVVIGRGMVTILQGERAVTHRGGVSFSLDELGSPSWDEIAAGVSGVIREQAAVQGRSRVASQPPPLDIPPQVLDLVERREAARKQRDWATADAMRFEIAALGCAVDDTPSGPQVYRVR